MKNRTQKKFNKVSIAGAGFCGLAAAYQLLLRGYQVDIYDPKGIGGGASGTAAGLLHPFPGEHAKRAAEADSGMRETLKLIELAEQELGMTVRTQGGIIRRAMNEKQESDYAKCAEKYPEETKWKNRELWIKNGLAVHTNLYLEGLWKVCQKHGAKFHRKALSNKAEGLVIWATGAGMADREFIDVGSLITPVRGQILEIEWPRDSAPLQHPVCSKVYAVMGLDGTSCFAGSTYERERSDDIPDVAFAAQEILPKLELLLPQLKRMPILDCKVGVRASAPGHRPLLKKLNEHSFAIGGMGSKGLLYHALYATKLMDIMEEV